MPDGSVCPSSYSPSSPQRSVLFFLFVLTEPLYACPGLAVTHLMRPIHSWAHLAHSTPRVAPGLTITPSGSAAPLPPARGPTPAGEGFGGCVWGSLSCGYKGCCPPFLRASSSFQFSISPCKIDVSQVPSRRSVGPRPARGCLTAVLLVDGRRAPRGNLWPLCSPHAGLVNP